MKTTSLKAKIIIFILAVIVVLLSISIGKTIIRNHRITNELTAIAESHGLKDVKIHVGGKIKGYDFYDVTVDSSNLESLTYIQMYSLDSSMHADDAFVSKYTSNGNTYEIFSYTNSIYKNGSQIHDGYWYSQSYADATKNDKNESNYNSSGNTGSSSYSSYKSPDKSYDKYHAKDYSNEEDFYEDHYDDFFDYYDAEQYYRDHKD